MFNRIKNILQNKRGGSTILEILISVGIITFILFFPIATFSTMHKQNLLNDVLTTGLQIIAVEGGLTDRAEDLVYDNLESRGLLPENSTETQRAKIGVSSNADARGMNQNNRIYRYDVNSKLSLTIKYPATEEVKMINALSKLIGVPDNNLPFRVEFDETDKTFYYVFKGYVLSEKVDYGVN